VHAPAYARPDADNAVFFGGGLWRPEPDALAKIRQRIAKRPADWKAVKADRGFRKKFDGVEGDALTRPPRGFDPDHPLIDDIKKKSFFAMHESSVKTAGSAKLIDEVAETFSAASPLMKFLCAAQGVKF
jgi:uncharacterized protein (TIGR02453 family)